MTGTLRDDALSIFHAALGAADAEAAVRRNFFLDNGIQAGRVRISLRGFRRVFLLAAGKAAPRMASAIQHVLGARLTGGIVITKHGHAALASSTLPTIEAGHPIPDEASLNATRRVMELLHDLNARDLLILAISGGASALLCAPVAGITLTAKQEATDLLLRAGADIFELNCVRKHLSLLKGGNLAALAYPATVLSLLLSDVIGDPLDVIASGLTAPDPTTFSQALSVLDNRGVRQNMPAPVIAHLERGARGEIAETPKPADEIFRNVHNVVVGSNRLALEAAAQQALFLGYLPLILSSRMQGETREVARVHAGILLEAIHSGNPIERPACILSGGETTATVTGTGKGGRNQEFALSAALALAGASKVISLSAGTDGTDGPTDAAGAIATGETVQRAQAIGLDALDHLARNDSYPFFDALGDLIKTGPTGTNVMDINILLAG